MKSFLYKRPWTVGVILALVPIYLLWLKYPIDFKSTIAIGQVTNVSISQEHISVSAGLNSTVGMTCYIMNISFKFIDKDKSNLGAQAIGSCDLAWLRNQAKYLPGTEMKVIYSEKNLTLSFLPELISTLELKVALGYSITFLLLGTWIAGNLVGRYPANALNVSIQQLPMKSLFLGGIFSFYVWLFFF